MLTEKGFAISCIALSLLSAGALYFLTGCGDSSHFKEPVEPPVEETPIALPSPTPIPSNPLCHGLMTFNDGPEGMLWKPESDNGGVLAVLIHKAFRRPFENCFVVRKDGSQEGMEFRGFSNGDRQTWKARLPGKNYMKTFTCEEYIQTCVWAFDGKPGERQD